MDQFTCQVINQNSLFSGFDAGKVSFRMMSFPRGSIIPSSYMGEAAVGVLIKGRIQVFSISVDGTAANISTLSPGDCFGISTIFTGNGLTTSLEADKDAEVAYITQKEFLELMASNPEYMVNYARLCNEKLQYLTKKIEMLVLPSCRARLAHYLLQNISAGSTVRLAVSKDHLAKTLCVSRASLFRELQVLSRLGFIEIDHKIIHVKNPNALRNLLNE